MPAPAKRALASKTARKSAKSRSGLGVLPEWNLADLYEGYTNADCVFDTANTDRLLGRLHDEDRTLLDFDVRRIQWRSYIQDVHIPGLRRHVLKEDARSSVSVHG